MSTTTSKPDNRGTHAWQMAVREFIAEHPDEFATILGDARECRGLPRLPEPPPAQARPETPAPE